MLSKKQVIQLLVEIRKISTENEIKEKMESEEPREYKKKTLEELNKYLLDQAMPQYQSARKAGEIDGEINAYRKVLSMKDEEWEALCLDINKAIRPYLDAKYPKNLVEFFLGD